MKFESITLGILGGGQLGRMSALAASRLGIKVHIYTPDEDSPAGQVAAKTFTGEYGDKKKLKKFAESVDVVSYEFENIPVETVRYIRKLRPVYPNDRLLEISQNRIAEKKYLNDIGIPTAKWAPVRSAHDIELAVSKIGGKKFILKTARLGYDGKGQLVHRLRTTREELEEIKREELDTRRDGRLHLRGVRNNRARYARDRAHSTAPCLTSTKTTSFPGA